ncbi:MAG TPA: hypothetical protein ENI59_01620 [Euryarchaeota archaeon]|nr:hypothetical protein [Euryarchaeota archaeon]
MKTPGFSRKISDKRSVITKEFLIGLLAISLGAYNILATLGYISWYIKVPQLIANILLVLAGLFLWLTAYKLSRYKYHTKRLF